VELFQLEGVSATQNRFAAFVSEAGTRKKRPNKRLRNREKLGFLRKIFDEKKPFFITGLHRFKELDGKI